MEVHGRGGSTWRIALWGTAVFILLIPLIAMQLTDEVAWDREDFVIFGVMLVAACSVYEIAARLTHNTTRRAIAGIGIAAVFMLVWLDLAAGIVGGN